MKLIKSRKGSPVVANRFSREHRGVVFTEARNITANKVDHHYSTSMVEDRAL